MRFFRSARMMTSAGVEPGRQRHPSQGEAGVAGHGAIADVGVDVELSAGRRRFVDVEDLAHDQPSWQLICLPVARLKSLRL